MARERRRTASITTIEGVSACSSSGITHAPLNEICDLLLHRRVSNFRNSLNCCEDEVIMRDLSSNNSALFIVVSFGFVDEMMSVSSLKSVVP